MKLAPPHWLNAVAAVMVAVCASLAHTNAFPALTPVFALVGALSLAGAAATITGAAK